jgi:hypothetical protein
MGALALAGLGLKASFEATAQPRGESLDHLTYPNLAHRSATTKKDTHIDSGFRGTFSAGPRRAESD